MFENPLPGELVHSAPPRVTLRNAWAHPFDSAIAAARTCYAPRLIGPEEVTDKQRLNIEIGRAHVELQSLTNLVCRLLLEKKKQQPVRSVSVELCMPRGRID